MKLIVIGHLCLDRFENQETFSSGSDEFRWGGIFFSLATLANIVEDALICPVFGVGEEEYEPLVHRLRRYSNVDTSGIFRLPGATNRVTLIYENTEKRVECSESIAPPIPFEKIEAFLPADGALVNMISGYDLTLDTLNKLRMMTQLQNTYIHLDLHSLTLGIDAQHRRFPQPIENWRRWCYLADTVQMNEEEATALPMEYLPEEDLVKQILSLGLRGCIVTRGSRGATGWAQDHKRIQRIDIPPVKMERIVDPTGCGDVFAAAFFYHFSKHHSVATAAKFANRIAAFNATYIGSDGIDIISQARKEIEVTG